MDLTHIPISKILLNPGNPRGIDIRVQDEKLSYLKDSIKQFGVLVPIVVSKKGDKYLLIDGERRYWASIAVGLKRLPAFIIDQKGSFTQSDILFRMFQIHHNREQWGPVQQCHALEDEYSKIAREAGIKSIRDDRAWLKAVSEELVNRTGIEYRTALNRVHFLRWPEDIRQRLYKNPEEQGYWYICEIEEKIVIPALINYPEYFETVPVDEIRRDLFAKLEQHAVDKATDVRRVAPFFRASMTRESDRNKVKRILAKLHKNRDMTYADAQEELVRSIPDVIRREPVSPRKLHSMACALQIAVEEFEMTAFGTARRRAKASRSELVSVMKGLVASLQDFLAELEG